MSKTRKTILILLLFLLAAEIIYDSFSRGIVGIEGWARVVTDSALIVVGCSFLKKAKISN